MLSPEQSQKILQVGPAASLDDIEAAYQKWRAFWNMCQLNVSRGDQRALAEQELQRIEVAHQVLSEHVLNRTAQNEYQIRTDEVAAPAVKPPPLPRAPPPLHRRPPPPPDLYAASGANPGDFAPSRISIRSIEQSQQLKQSQRRQTIGLLLSGIAIGAALFLGGQWLLDYETEPDAADVETTDTSSACGDPVVPLRCVASPAQPASVTFVPVCAADVLVDRAPMGIGIVP